MNDINKIIFYMVCCWKNQKGQGGGGRNPLCSSISPVNSSRHICSACKLSSVLNRKDVTATWHSTAHQLTQKFTQIVLSYRRRGLVPILICCDHMTTQCKASCGFFRSCQKKNLKRRAYHMHFSRINVDFSTTTHMYVSVVHFISLYCGG